MMIGLTLKWEKNSRYGETRTDHFYFKGTLAQAYPICVDYRNSLSEWYAVHMEICDVVQLPSDYEGYSALVYPLREDLNTLKRNY